tara:strand:+ start:274 stop:597 length:324 start_codon:yes stop_codon:yes gene_type:complete
MTDSTKQYKTRNGLEVVIHTTTMGGEYPVQGAYKDGGGWDVASWTNEGDFQRGYRSKFDLVEIPQIIERWVVILDDGDVVLTNLYLSEDSASQVSNKARAVKVEIQI